jgi:multicomponent Na+:H+ antiporter subunit G
VNLIELIGAGLCAVGGAFFLLVAGVGVLRLPDAYCRSHALGKAMTLGVILLLLAMGIVVDGLAWWKILTAIGAQVVTIPVASHLFCLIAYRRKLRHWTAKGWSQT